MLLYIIYITLYYVIYYIIYNKVKLCSLRNSGQARITSVDRVYGINSSNNAIFDDLLKCRVDAFLCDQLKHLTVTLTGHSPHMIMDVDGLVPQLTDHLLHHLRPDIDSGDVSITASCVGVCDNKCVDLLKNGFVSSWKDPPAQLPNGRKRANSTLIREHPVSCSVDFMRVVGLCSQVMRNENARFVASTALLNIKWHKSDCRCEEEKKIGVVLMDTPKPSSTRHRTKEANPPAIVKTSASFAALMTGIRFARPNKPFRESQLNSVLFETMSHPLTCNVVLVTVSPLHKNVDSTYTSLHFANSICNNNERHQSNTSDYKKLIQGLAEDVCSNAGNPIWMDAEMDRLAWSLGEFSKVAAVALADAEKKFLAMRKAARRTSDCGMSRVSSKISLDYGEEYLAKQTESTSKRLSWAQDLTDNIKSLHRFVTDGGLQSISQSFHAHFRANDFRYSTWGQENGDGSVESCLVEASRNLSQLALDTEPHHFHPSSQHAIKLSSASDCFVSLLESCGIEIEASPRVI
eukprot:GHVL01014384.1.p1 GENE.GHVL01014384.1~~GHVL01014384.1.p1  ORF type:complete len:519 (-),score=74.22 GHVL01014384.1:69-1625(-)